MTEWNGGAGPRIVAIGGGTGLSTMLRGLKSRTRSLTAIVTVADDGGGSGIPRSCRSMPEPPPPSPWPTTAAARACCGRIWVCPLRGTSATAWRPWPTPSR